MEVLWAELYLQTEVLSPLPGNVTLFGNQVTADGTGQVKMEL